MRGHAAGLGSSLQHGDMVAALERMVGGSEPHHARSDDDDARQGQNSKTICE
jgi:hypothetical protein